MAGLGVASPGLSVQLLGWSRTGAVQSGASALWAPLPLQVPAGGSHGARRQRVPARQLAVRADLAEQMKEMMAAEKRWARQVQEGRVKSMSPKEAGYALQLTDYTLLDVRPSYERDKAAVKNSVWIPMYDVDKAIDPGSLLKKLTSFTMGGWWSGDPVTKYNERFMPDVVAKIPKSANVVVTCQRGLRSLAACEQMYKVGYRNLFWISGGLEAAEEGDLEREGSQPFKFAGIGGISEFLGWTDQQRAQAAKEGWGYRAMFFGRLVVVVLFADALFVGAQSLPGIIQQLGR